MNRTITAYKHDPILTLKARNIFGEDLVEAAYIAADFVINHDAHLTASRTIKALDDATFSCGGSDAIIFNGLVIIKFLNGKSVSLYAGEYAEIKNCSYADHILFCEKDD